MSHKSLTQTGFSVVEALLVIIALAGISFTGYYVYHSQKMSGTSRVIVLADKNSEDIAQSTLTPTFVSYGSDGLTLAAPSDVQQLTTASTALKDYFKNSIGIGKVVPECGSGGCDGSTVRATLIVNDVYGDYADGAVNPSSAASIWGPLPGGSIGQVMSMQDTPTCSMLRSKGIPAGFHIRCDDGTGNLQQYNG